MGIATNGRIAIRGAVGAAVLAAMVLIGGAAHANGAGGLVGVVDPVTGQWHLRGPDGFTTSFFFGDPGDVPFLGDWDCDGDETPGLYRQSDGFVYLRNSNTQGVADIRFFFGNPGDVPLAGDFDDDGCDTVSLYRPSGARVYIINELGSADEGLGAADLDYGFGNPGDKPFVADFDGDGVDTIGLHRESTGLVYYRNTHTQGIADAQFVFGDPGDLVFAADWTGGGSDTVGLFRPEDSRMYLRHSNTQGIADEAFGYGIPRVVPVGGATGIAAVAAPDRAWTVNTVANTPQDDWGRFASIGFGYTPAGLPMISHGYRDQLPSYRLALSHCGNRMCTDGFVGTHLSALAVADSTSMATGTDGQPVWTFHDGLRLFAGRCIDVFCHGYELAVVAPQQDPDRRYGVLSDIEIAPDGLPIVAYMNTNPSGLRLARCTDLACVANNSVAVASPSGFNRFDLEIGSDQLHVIAFIESTVSGVDLTALHCSNAACTQHTEATIQHWDLLGAIIYPSMAIGPDGFPIIAYNDLTTALKVVHCEDVACQSRTINTVHVGNTEFASVDLGGDGLPFVAFRHAGALKVAHCDDLACSSSTVATIDPGPMVGLYASLGTDPFGMPMVAYYDAAGRDLVIARLGT